MLAILVAIQMHVSLQVSAVESPGGSPFLVDLYRHSINMGWIAMDIFFVISGFLIGVILFRSMDSGRAAFRFYVRRAFRTIPLYYVCLLLLLAAVKLWPSASVNGASRIQWLPEIFYLSNYMREGRLLMPWSWTLSVEEHFYLLGPWVVFAVARIKTHVQRLLFLGLLGLSALVLRWTTYAGLADGPINIFKDLFIATHLRYDTFVAGLAVAYLHHHFSDRMETLYRKRMAIVVAWAITLGLLAVFMSPTLNKYPFMYLSYGGAAPEGIVREVAFRTVFYFGFLSSLALAPLIQLLLYSDSAVRRVFGQRLFLPAATLSYGTYLVHLPIAKVLAEELMKAFPSFRGQAVLFWLTCFGLTLACSYGFAYVLHLLVEKPFLVLRDRLVPSIAAITAAATLGYSPAARANEARNLAACARIIQLCEAAGISDVWKTCVEPRIQQKPVDGVDVSPQEAATCLDAKKAVDGNRYWFKDVQF